MNNKFFVPFETAKALKEAGYNEGCRDWYDRDGLLWAYETETTNRELLEVQTSAPTYHEVLDWLEGKGLYIDYNINSWYSLETKEHKMSYVAYIVVFEPRSHCARDAYQSATYYSREEAIYDAIFQAIKTLTNKKKK